MWAASPREQQSWSPWQHFVASRRLLKDAPAPLETSSDSGEGGEEAPGYFETPRGKSNQYLPGPPMRPPSSAASASSPQ